MELKRIQSDSHYKDSSVAVKGRKKLEFSLVLFTQAIPFKADAVTKNGVQ